MRRPNLVVALVALGITILFAPGVQAEDLRAQEETPAAAVADSTCPVSSAILPGAPVLEPEQDGTVTSAEGLGDPGWKPMVEEEPCGTYYPGNYHTSWSCSCSGGKLRKTVTQDFCNFCGCVTVTVSSGCTSYSCGF